MAELTSEAESIALANELFKPHKKKLSESAIDDYGKIAWFLSRPDKEFEKALDDVSVFLWQEYCILFNKYEGRMRNMFTSSIRTLAQNFGWKYESKDHVVLTGGISGELYEKWTRAGVLFKDQMDLKHGEHSHTLQWLAICSRRIWMGLSNDPTVLYKSIFDALPNKQDKTAPFSCWSWTVDTFPADFGKGPNKLLLSDSYRTPQMVMKYILNSEPGTSFVKTYLQYRYKRRNWFTGMGGKGYDAVSGTSSKSSGDTKHDKVRDWKTVEKMAYSRDATQASLRDPAEKKTRVQVKFHDLPGYLTDPASI